MASLNNFVQTPLVRQQINSKAEHDTNGLIKDLLSEEYLSDSSVHLVLTNALYFKGDWDINDDMQNPTNHSAESSIHHNPDSRSNLGYDFHWIESFHCHFAKEKYVGAEIIAVQRNIVDRGYSVLGHKFRRPSKDKRHINLTYYYPRPLYDDDDDDGDDDASGHSIPNETLMEVGGREIPKFNVSSEVDASTVLRMRGITLLFSGEGLTGMLSHSHLDLSQKLYLFKILQKTSIDLNEQGSEAATATIAIVMSGCPPYLPRVCYEDCQCYGPGILDAYDGLMARVGLQVHQHV